jgi:MFS family permease
MTVQISPHPAPAAQPATEQPRRAVPRHLAFWLVALVLGAAMLGTTLPTPLYDIYQAQWHFSAAVVTVTFAVYGAAVLVTLLLAGRSSDQAGRKPVLAAALAASALSTVVFILARNVETLIAARIVSGVSAGLVTGTATAALTELIRASATRRASLVATAANMGGLGLGPLIAGLLAQYAPHPTVLVFEVYLAVLAAAGLCLLFVPETVTSRRRPTLRFVGLGIPERAGTSSSRPAWPRLRPSPCSGCSVRWCPVSSAVCCTSTAMSRRAASCS